MRRDRAGRASLVAGTVGAAIGIGFGVATGIIPDSTAPGLPGVALVLLAALLSVPFALAAGAAYLALTHRVVLPLVAVVGFSAGAVVAVPAVRGLHAGEVLIGVLVVGPLVVVLALLEALGRARRDRLAAPPSPATWRAVSVGVAAALLYSGVFAVRAVIPLWRIDTGVPSRLSPALDLALTLWYVLGAALVLVGVPVALNRRYGLVAPAVGLLAFLAVDLAFVQPAVAEGSDLVVALLVGVWPTVAVGLAALGAGEWWFRARRGDYDDRGDDPGDGGDGPDGGGDDEGLTVEGGLFGDRL
jgi:hypothetical protein